MIIQRSHRTLNQGFRKCHRIGNTYMSVSTQLTFCLTCSHNYSSDELTISSTSNTRGPIAVPWIQCLIHVTNHSVKVIGKYMKEYVLVSFPILVVCFVPYYHWTLSLPFHIFYKNTGSYPHCDSIPGLCRP